ncbi:MAG: FAD-dependent oxidoreductase [Actinomycetota bacterium]|jgi:sulfide:quinone oxidoreductase|nr:FAD-dependent oxidoreductase [Actinomycetota bacterium]
MGPVRIVIVGGSFGGLTTAYELRRRLTPERAEITLLARDDQFRFVPSFPWVATGRRRLEQISFPLAGPLAKKQVRFANETVTHIDTAAKVVATEAAGHPYDFLIVATGHRSANEAVPGLGPFDGPGHSPMSAGETVELAQAIRRLLTEPGPVVIGAAPGASCIGPVYELAFELDHLLRRRGLRHQVPISLLTPEPFLGHMGMGGAGTIRQLLEAALEERDIAYRTSTAITLITEDAVETADAAPTPSVCSIIIPPLAGVEAVAASEGLANPKGFLPVDDHYRHLHADGVYAVGVAVALPPADATPVPVNFPKTGHMTEQMAKIAAVDLAARLHGHEAPTAELSARCILDMGDRAAYLAVDPVRPPRNRIPAVSEGRPWLVAKMAFERTYLAFARRGKLVPTTLGW